MLRSLVQRTCSALCRSERRTFKEVISASRTPFSAPSRFLTSTDAEAKILSKNLLEMVDKTKAATVVIREDMKKFDEAFKTLTTRIGTLETRIGTLETNEETLTNEVRAQKTSIGTLEADKIELNSRVGSLEKTEKCFLGRKSLSKVSELVKTVRGQVGSLLPSDANVDVFSKDNRVLLKTFPVFNNWTDEMFDALLLIIDTRNNVSHPKEILFALDELIRKMSSAQSNKGKGNTKAKRKASSRRFKRASSPKPIGEITLLPEEDLKLIDGEILDDFVTAIECSRIESQKQKDIVAKTRTIVAEEPTTQPSAPAPELSEEEKKKQKEREFAKTICRAICSIYVRFGIPRDEPQVTEPLIQSA